MSKFVNHCIAVLMVGVLLGSMLACEPATLEPPPPVETEAETATPRPTSTPPEPTATPMPEASPTPTADIMSEPVPTVGPVEIPEDIRVPGFASLYEAVPVQKPGDFQGTDYSLPVDMSRVSNAEGLDLSPAQQALLSQHGFVVGPDEWLEFFQLYEACAIRIPPFL